MSNHTDNYNKGGFIAFVGSMAFCLLFFIYISFIHPGVDLQEVQEDQAAAAEMQLADGSGAVQKVDVSQIEKPWIPSDDMIAHGAGVYKQACAVCHGPQGKGDGPAGMNLVPPARNLVAGGWKKGGTSIALFQTLQNGIEGGSMASFKHLPVVDRWGLVQWIRSITEDKPEDNVEELEAFAKTAD